MLKKLMIAAVVCASQMVPTASADVKDLIKKLPADANCVVVVDVDALLASPVAAKEAWAQVREQRAANNTPLLVPVGTSDLALAAMLDLQSMDTVWQTSLLDMSKPVSMKNLAFSAGEDVESVAGNPAVGTANFLYVQTGPNQLATVEPANRQLANRWIANPAGTGLSPYLAAAAEQIGATTQIVMAVDLDGVTSPERVKRRLKDEPIKALVAKNIDIDTAAKLLGGIKGVTLAINAGDKAAGKMTIDFSGDPSVLGAATKDALLEMLSRTGMYVPDFSSWEVSTEGNRIVATGSLSTSAVRRLLSVLETPQADNATAVDNWQKPAAGNEAAEAAIATQKYFAAVSQIVDNLSTGDSMSQLAGWCTRDARRIDRLPILGVDPDVVKFGAFTSAKLNEIARTTYVGQVNASAAASGVSSPVINYGGYDGNGNWNGGMSEAEAHATLENANRQRRQVSQQERARSMDAAAQIFDQVRAARNDVKLSMTQKYKVEF